MRRWVIVVTQHSSIHEKASSKIHWHRSSWQNEIDATCSDDSYMARGNQIIEHPRLFVLFQATIAVRPNSERILMLRTREKIMKIQVCETECYLNRREGITGKEGGFIS